MLIQNIFNISANQKIKVNGMEIDNYLAQDYEKALIEKFRPSWNGRK